MLLKKYYHQYKTCKLIVWSVRKKTEFIVLVVEITQVMLTQVKLLEKHQNWHNISLSHYKKLTYCLKCKKHTESVNSKVLKTKNGRTMLSSKCAKQEEQEAKGLLSSLGLKTPLYKIQLLGDILFYCSCI